MLNRVLEILSGQGWFDLSRPFEKTIHLLDSNCLGMLLTRRGTPDTYVKFSRQTDLAAQAGRWALASRCLGPRVPGFVGHLREGSLSLFVTRAVKYRDLDARRLRRMTPDSPLLTDIAGCMSTPRKLAAKADSAEPAHAGLIGLLEAQDAAKHTPASAGRWSKVEAEGLVAVLAPAPQCANFVVDRLGEDGDGRLLVLGCDDFGAIELPGFDLFTLELSIAGDFDALSKARRQPTDAMVKLVAQACEHMDLPISRYHRLTPTYALLREYLEQRRGPVAVETSHPKTIGAA